MTCGACGEQNRDGARFCSACGVRMAARCATCDAELSAGGKFCDACGAPVVAAVAVAPDQARKTVTVVFADLAGSTAMQERMDPESVRAFSARYYAAMRSEVERHGGRVVKFVGDGVMAVFGVPEVAEDDARRALAAAVGMTEAFAALATDLGLALRVGVNTGEVVVDEDDDDVVGDTVNVAARLESAAPPGRVLVADDTYRLVRDHATFEEPEQLQVKGRVEPVTALVLIAIGAAPADSTATVFVGRDRELRTLVDALDAAEATGTAGSITVLGSPGVGKSRLLGELHAAVADRAVVLVGRCVASSTATFAPIADIVAGAVELDGVLAADPESDRVVAGVGFLLGDGEPGTPEETFWAVRRLIGAAARTQPVVVVVDDVHWAEPQLLDLLEHLAEWLGASPVLLVTAARPELRDVRPALAEVGPRRAAVISLEGLDPGSTSALAADLLGSGGLPPDLVERIVAATEGNPLFVRELVRMLVDDGVLRPEGDAWVSTVAASAIEVPPTISSLLAARVERLRPEERTVLERAAVVGQDVYRGALAELLPAGLRPQLDTILESLRRKELLEPSGTYWIDEPVLRFHHALIRDAAYRRLLKEARADLHERVAAWVTTKTGRGTEHDELIGFHLERAQANRRELGALDDHGRQVADEAGSRLAAAAHRALHRDDLPAAATLTERALVCLDGGGSARAELLLIRCEALLSTGDVVAARPAVEELARVARDDERLEAWSTSFTVQLATLAGNVDLVEAGARALAAAQRLTELGDPTGAAKAHRVHASVLARLGRVADAEAALDRALNAAREADDRRQISGVLAAAPLAALWGPSPVARAGGRCLDVVRLLRITTGALAVEAISTRCQAVLEAFRGRDAEARKLLANARRTLEDLGLRHGLLELELFAGLVELAAGDAAAADEHLRIAHDGFGAMGAGVDAAQAAALRARAALALGRDADALALADEAEQLGGTDLKTAIAWHAAKAEVLARRGEAKMAIELARAAVALAEPTDALVDHADALAALGTVLYLSGDPAAGTEAVSRARALYEQKGATALVERLGLSVAAVPRAPARAASGPVDNGAARVHRRCAECIFTRDWDGLRRLMLPAFRYEDRRTGASSSFVGAELQVENMRQVVALGVTRIDLNVIATRGDRAAVLRYRMSGDGGDYEAEFLAVVIIDEEGLATGIIAFDLDDLAGAMAELTATEEDRLDNLAVRTSRAHRETFVRRDWAGFAELLLPEFVVEDHRRGISVVSSRDEWLTGVVVMADLGITDIVRRTIAVRGERLMLGRAEFHGAGGDVSGSVLDLSEVDEDGRSLHLTLHDPDEIVAAQRELDERYLAGEGAPHAPTLQPWFDGIDAFNRRDWDRVREVFATDVVAIDHRLASFGETSGREPMLARLQAGVEVMPDCVLLAVRVLQVSSGAALLERRFWTELDGELDTNDTILVLEVSDGRICLHETFDISDLKTARRRFSELGALENAATRTFRAGCDAFRRRDFDGFLGTLAEGAVFEDCRPGFALVADRHQWAELSRIVADIGVSELIPTPLAVRGDRLAAVGCEYVAAVADAFTESVIFVAEVDEDEQVTAGVCFRVEDEQLALAELDRRVAASGELSNTATRVLERYAAAIERGDIAAVDALVGADAVIDDRRQVLGWSVQGHDDYVASVASSISAGIDRMRIAPLALRGERLALARVRPGSSSAGTEMQMLVVYEVDDLQRIAAAVRFDDGDLDGALVELDERFSRGEAAAHGPMIRAGARFISSRNRRDSELTRAVLSPDVVLIDHRPLGTGTLTGVDALVTHHDAMLGVADCQLIIRHYLEIGDGVALFENVGLAGDFEIVSYVVGGVRGDQVVRMEFFDPEQLGEARARFAELAAPRLRNTAVDLVDAIDAAFAARDWERMLQLTTEDRVSEDRRAGILNLAVGRDEFIVTMQALADGGATVVSFEPVATRGNDFCLGHATFSGEVDEFYVEVLILGSARDGALCSTVVFDSGDLDAAMDELNSWWIATLDPARAEVALVSFRQVSAYNAKDWQALRAGLDDQIEVRDDRPFGREVTGADELIEQMQQVFELAADASVIAEEVLAIEPHGGLLRSRIAGTLPDGGSFELLVIGLGVVAGGRWTRLEYFDEHDVDAALARLAELSP